MDHTEVKPLPKVDHTPAELGEQSKLLLMAANLIEKHGLSKHCQRDSDGRMCVAGAIIVAAGGTPETFYDLGLGDGNESCYPTLAAKEAAFRFSQVVTPGSGGPAYWNNRPERTKDEVVSKLRAVALGL